MSHNKQKMLFSSCIIYIAIMTIFVVIELFGYYVFKTPIGLYFGSYMEVEMEIHRYLCLGGFLYEIVEELDADVTHYHHMFRLSLFIFESVFVFVISFMIVWFKTVFEQMKSDDLED